MAASNRFIAVSKRDIEGIAAFAFGSPATVLLSLALN
jgi:hypothetical protein